MAAMITVVINMKALVARRISLRIMSCIAVPERWLRKSNKPPLALRLLVRDR